MGGLQRINVLGVQINATNMVEAVSVILGWLNEGERHYVCSTGVHGVMECQRDEALLRIHNGSGLTVPDGMPLVWAGRLQGFRQMGRVFGPDLMLALCEASVRYGYTHFLYGGANPGVVDALCISLTQRFPGIKIVGTFTPPFRPLNETEEKDFISQVERAKPDFFWVGIGCPKQERFMAEYLPKLETKVMLGIGAAFDFHTGRAQDAPDWIKNAGVQWLHRLYQEPRRLWKRYLINNPVFVIKFILQLMNQRHKYQ